MGGGQDGNGGWGGNSGWGAPGYESGMTGGAPDWAAMAEANEREARKKRLLRIGIGLVSALALAGIVVVAVAMQGSGDKKPSADQLPTGSNSAGAACVPPSAMASKGGTDLRLGASAQVGTVDGHSGLALTLRGAPDGYAEVNSVVVNTCTSFTISAVARNNAPQEPRAVVSQGSDGFFSFYLGRDFSGTHNQWVFKVQTAAQSGKAVEALSTGPATTGQWTTLTGVYDAKAGTISLYVDGVLAKTSPVSGIVSTNGPIEIGRARFKSHWVDSWDGSIADVQVWDRPLAPNVVAQVAKTRSANVSARATWFRF